MAPVSVAAKARPCRPRFSVDDGMNVLHHAAADAGIKKPKTKKEQLIGALNGYHTMRAKTADAAQKGGDVIVPISDVTHEVEHGRGLDMEGYASVEKERKGTELDHSAVDKMKNSSDLAIESHAIVQKGGEDFKLVSSVGAGLGSGGTGSDFRTPTRSKLFGVASTQGLKLCGL